MSPLATSIYQTLAFFDALDLPLTLVEIKSYLVALTHNSPPPSLILREGVPPLRIRGGEGELLSEIEKTINTDLRDWLSYKDGFYFLAGRQELVRLRQERYRISLKRLRRARRALWGLRFLPYIRAVGISGSLSFLNSKPSSDIDLFVITKKGRIWLTRMLLSLYFQILGKRRHGPHITDRFCLNHYVREGRTVTQDKDLFTAAAYASIIPVLGFRSLEKFLQNNPWIQEYLQLRVPRLQEVDHFFGFEFSLLQKVSEFFLEITLVAPFFNLLFRSYQLRRIERLSDVIVSDDELSFHFRTHGQRVLAKLREKLNRVIQT